MKSTDSHLVSKQMTHNICFILLALDEENNNDPLKIWGLYLFVLAFPLECVNQLGSEVKSIPARSAGWFKTLDVWHRLMLCDIYIFFLLIWSLELVKPYHKLLHNCHVSSWRPHHPDFEIFDGSRLTQPLKEMYFLVQILFYFCLKGWNLRIRCQKISIDGDDKSWQSYRCWASDKPQLHNPMGSPRLILISNDKADGNKTK